MNTWVISDTHFGHKRMIEDGWRPFPSTYDMELTLIKNWNSVVEEGDVVYHLGDVCLGDRDYYKRFIEPRLNGSVIYVKGNHDNKKMTKTLCIKIKHCGVEAWLVHNPNEMQYGEYVIHGHIHKKGIRDLTEPRDGVKYYNVNCEFHNYTPVLLDKVIERMKR